ncbi:MAG: hypothetical protein NC117_01900 [Pseudoflavonifractor sp.]|nr:hypothetical protein [Pseudoflavonifractor sp.]
MELADLSEAHVFQNSSLPHASLSLVVGLQPIRVSDAMPVARDGLRGGSSRS